MVCSSCGSHSAGPLVGSPTGSPRMAGSRIVLLTTFRKQRNNERTEIARARGAAEECARTNP